MRIRKHQESDRAAIIELLRLNTPEYFSPNKEKDLIYYLHEHAGNYFVAEQDGVILGCAGFNISQDGNNGGLSWDFVHPAGQGTGIGSALTLYRLEEIRKIESVKVFSVRTSQMAYRFYEKFGLIVKNIVPDYWDKGYDLYDMEIDINLAGRMD
ncbi:MAG TPA: GNAT family N-acetyltransferase [Dyadobacter sp.]|jgi:N-acetylglutamate synthase-like GNAT family acetyltransferase|nr:GNAT family N-acetyltransferase [Dyadobacter sp.]